MASLNHLLEKLKTMMNKSKKSRSYQKKEFSLNFEKVQELEMMSELSVEGVDDVFISHNHHCIMVSVYDDYMFLGCSIPHDHVPQHSLLRLFDLDTRNYLRKIVFPFAELMRFQIEEDYNGLDHDAILIFFCRRIYKCDLKKMLIFTETQPYDPSNHCIWKYHSKQYPSGFKLLKSQHQMFVWDNRGMDIVDLKLGILLKRIQLSIFPSEIIFMDEETMLSNAHIHRMSPISNEFIVFQHQRTNVLIEKNDHSWEMTKKFGIPNSEDWEVYSMTFDTISDRILMGGDNEIRVYTCTGELVKTISRIDARRMCLDERTGQLLVLDTDAKITIYK